MERQAFLTLTTSSQWVLFLAIGLIIYSWVDKKIMFQQLGQVVFTLLGIFALWVVLSHQIRIPEVAKGAKPPVEAMALSYFSGLIGTGVIGLFAFIMGLVKSSWAKFINIILIPVALSLFFMVYQLQRV
jgi:hypothetical protein